MALLEPADGSGAQAGEDDATIPSVMNKDVHPGGFPDGEHVSGVAAGHVDGVAFRDFGFEVGGLAKKRDVLGAARLFIESAVEAGD